MTIFTVAPDVNNYLTLQESDLELAIQATTGSPISLEGTPVLADWQVLAVDWLFVPGEDDGLKKPDIATLGATGLAINQKVADYLSPALRDCCELLPLNLNGDQWFLIHPLNRFDALDEARSEFKERRGGRRQYAKVVLNEDSVTDGRLFRVSGLGLSLYSSDEENSFYTLIKKGKLSGVWFREVNAHRQCD